ncbi:SGNH/GDSL hydrolase family protein [Achromobacter piechaudii]|uniref:SGNH hydrolase-type esterase domain-containing protein n=1 Tax=Achromobacter piechaudii TaxID=72556 RepID=A0ABN7F7I4_9BURK|nr:SGNH/GDSL hydrolase family protein [Achromobacter piechaudii]CAB3728835.1 hypothetical protein LMG1873_04618 [Achromobacter piechaudii]CAB3905078.1 hypothetical protein LMG2828_04705 [Achromobacter piechaudii]
MAVENTKYIAGLNASLPTGNDPKSQGDDHLRLLKTVLQQVFGGFPGEVVVAGTEAAGATVNDYQVTITPALTAYAANTIVVFRSTHENTGPATLRVSDLSTKPLLSPQGTALRAKTLTANTWALAAYDGTNFRLLTANSQAIYDYVDQTAFSAALPQQAGNGGSVLRTDGASAKWGAPFPSGVLAAVSDGVANADSAFAALEAGTVGQEIDLGGKTFVVTARPTKNNYVNGVFKESGNTRLAAPFKTVLVPRPHVSYFGGQLRALKDALADPTFQMIVVPMMGDSRTWGRTLPENFASTPRNGDLADPRDGYASDSWVNQFKRHIGRRYFNNAVPELSNWSISPSGQSTAKFKKTIQLYTGKANDPTSITGVAKTMAPFSDPVIGASSQVEEVSSLDALLGWQHRLRLGSAAGTVSLSFPFTGTEFTIVYSSLGTLAADLEVQLNGVSVTTFYTGDNGTSYQNRKKITLPSFARNATVTLIARYPGAYTVVKSVYLEAVEIEKTCVIINQGVIGADALRYGQLNFGGSGSVGPSIVDAQTSFAFLDLGTNDRANYWPTARAQPNGRNNFRRNLENIIDRVLQINSAVKLVLMNAAPAENESPSAYSFTMQDVRDTVRLIGKGRSLDVIDNYSPFVDLDLSATLADGLHENLLGHSVHADNIIGAFEQA